jgi:hypothetical protein
MEFARVRSPYAVWDRPVDNGLSDPVSLEKVLQSR